MHGLDVYVFILPEAFDLCILGVLRLYVLLALVPPPQGFYCEGFSWALFIICLKNVLVELDDLDLIVADSSLLVEAAHNLLLRCVQVVK